MSLSVRSSARSAGLDALSRRVGCARVDESAGGTVDEEEFDDAVPIPNGSYAVNSWSWAKLLSAMSSIPD